MIDSEKTFKERTENRIDIADIKADEYFKKFKNLYYLKIGFDQLNPVPSSVWFKFPSFLRCMPDSIVVWEDKFFFIEIKGCRDTLKIKIELKKRISLNLKSLSN